MNTPKISVIIPTYRDWDSLQLCLDALVAQSLQIDDFEIIISNNEPSVVAPDGFTLPQNARMIATSVPGSYAARNAAVLVSRGSMLAFTDSDCVPAQHWLASAVTVFENDPAVCRISGPVQLFVPDGKWTATALYDRTFMLQQEKFAALGKAATANTFARREVFGAIGPFDQSLLTGGDHEWSERAQKAGFTLCFCSQVIVAHPARSRFRDLIRKIRRFEGGKVARKRMRGDRVILPRLRYLLVPIPRLVSLLRNETLTPSEALRVWVVLYAVRLCSVAEQIRLTVFQGSYERR